MITERLKIETRANHDDTERITFSKEIMGGDLTLEQYKLIITKTYIIHRAIEPALESHPGIASIQELELNKRLKSQLIAQDLISVDIDPNSLKIPEKLPLLDTLEDVLGVMYVMEGSTLGGMYIHKALKRNVNLNSISEFHFYNCYGENTRANWAEFQQILKSKIDSKEKADKVIESAKRMFDYYAEIFQS